MPILLSNRALSFIGFALCAGLIAAALYFQYAAGLEPCPLCIVQRVAFIAAGVVLLLCALHNPPDAWPANLWRRLYGGLAAGFAVLGAGVAARHVYLQNLPPGQIPECGPGLAFMLDAFPLQQTLALILRGSGECAEVQWNLFYLSMPAWALIWFVVIAILSGVVAARK